MKVPFPLIVGASVIVLSALVGVVWFESPKSQRTARRAHFVEMTAKSGSQAPKSTPLVAPGRDTHKAKPNAGSTRVKRSAEVVDLAPRGEDPQAVGEAPALEAEPADSLDVANDVGESTADLTQHVENASAPESDTSNDDELAPSSKAPLVAFLVRDNAGGTAPDSAVIARWRENGEEREQSGVLGAQGRIEFNGELGDPLVFEVRSRGHAPLSLGPIDRAQLRGATYGVTLERGRELAVHVAAAASTSVRVVAWPVGNEGLAASFEGELDAQGELTLDTLWSGPIEAVALADGAWSSAVAANDGERASLELDAAPLARVVGRVLDSNGAPVDGARVQACAASRGFAVGCVAASTTDRNGRFEIDAPAASGLLAIHADGWAPRWVACDGELDAIQLRPRTTLTVRLIGVESSDEHWTLSAWGIEDIALTRIVGGASIVLEQLAPGPYSFALSGPDGAVRHFDYTLAAGDGSELELRVR